VRPHDVAGLPVSIAERVCDRAAPGEVFVTEVVELMAQGAGLEFDDRGLHELKGVPGRWQLSAVRG
jgi:class 3 adenylate cyclase